MDFLSEFVQATDHLPSPRIFRWWSAVAVVASVLGRDTYTMQIPGEPIYGNQFIVLVADPAGGKSWAIGKAAKLMSAFGHAGFSGDMPTPESLNKKMGKWFDGSDDARGRTFNLIAPEITTLLPDPSQVWWFQELAVLWDCPEEFSRPTKTQGIDILQNPYVTVLAGAQPTFFAEGFPKNVNGLGLPSRLVYVWAEEEMPINYDAKPDEEAWKEAGKSLSRIARVRRPVPMAPEAMAFFREWDAAGRPPKVPGVGLSKAYSIRRNMHLAKLALAVAMARHPEKPLIYLDDIEEAKRALFATEAEMHKAMSLAGGNPTLPKEREIVQFVKDHYAETHAPVLESLVRTMAARFFGPNMRTVVIDDLVSQRMLRGVVTPKGRAFTPGDNA